MYLLTSTSYLLDSSNRGEGGAWGAGRHGRHERSAERSSAARGAWYYSSLVYSSASYRHRRSGQRRRRATGVWVWSLESAYRGLLFY
jgi:hypothetical protein